MIDLADIERLLAARRPCLEPTRGRTRTAVAMILRETPGGAEMLFIERATRHGDPWSGDLAFPGGRREKGDGDPLETARRETLEEIGVDLRAEACLGRLDDLVGTRLPVLVACFAFALRAPTVLRLSEEVEQGFWVPLPHLADPARRLEVEIDYRGKKRLQPAMRLLDPGRRLLWGITYRLVIQFLQLLPEKTP